MDFMIIYIFGNLYILGSFIFFNWKFRNTTCFQDFLRYSLEVSLLLEDQPKVETTDGHKRNILQQSHRENNQVKRKCLQFWPGLSTSKVGAMLFSLLMFSLYSL